MQIVIFPFISRSGSTFLFNQLSQHPRIFVCPEAEILMHRLLIHPNQLLAKTPNLLDLIVTDSREDPKFSYWHLTESQIRQLDGCRTHFDVFCALLSAYRQREKPAATTVLFKGPRKLLKTCSVLSKADRDRQGVRLVSIVRDGRGSYASQKQSIRPFTGRPMQVSPIEAATQWCEFVEGFITLSTGSYKDLAYLVRYEDFIANNDTQVHQLLDFLGHKVSGPQSFSTADMAPRIPASQRALHQNINLPAMASRIYAWRQSLSDSEIYWYEKIAGSWLQHLGYPLVSPDHRWLRRYCSRIVFAFRLLYHKTRLYRTHRRLRGL